MFDCADHAAHQENHGALTGPDGILFEPATEKVYILGHGTPKSR
jgi:hypothetical protein